MPRSHSSIHLIVLMLVGASCRDGLTSLERTIVVRTDQSRYSTDEWVVITVENRGQGPVLFYHCDHHLGFEVEKRVAQQWENQFSVATMCLAIFPSGEYRLEPEAVYKDSIRLDSPGTYRLRFLTGKGSTERVDSNGFEIK